MIYFDNAATTPLLTCVRDCMATTLDTFGNPSSPHNEGQKARKILDDSRETIANCLSCEPDEIVFTSGGSESNNLALNVCGRSKRYVVSSLFEHHSIIKRLLTDHSKQLFVSPNEDGIITPKAFEKTIVANLNNIDQYRCSSIMMVNNEVGTIQPIKELAEISHFFGLPFHTDAVQAVGHMPIDVKDLDVDMLSLSGHKFGAPKGIGALYIKKSLQNQIFPMIQGGHQEYNLRAGTENVIGAAAMACALKHMCENMDTYNDKMTAMQKYIFDFIRYNIPDSVVNGSLKNRISSNINISINGVDGESLVLALNGWGICVSAGSACTSGEPTPSHVLEAMGRTPDEAACAIRISVGPQNTMNECIRAMKILKETATAMRELS